MSLPHLSSLPKILDREVRDKNLRLLGWRAKEFAWSVLRPAMPDPVFIIGCSRSGTTVTFETIAASGHFLHFDYEIPQFWNSLYGPLNNGWQSEAADASDARPEHHDRALAYFYARLGAGPVLDKTCINTLRVPYLHALFPQAKFIFIQRDGRDNVSSMIDGWRLGRVDGGFGLERNFGPSPEPVAINGGEFHEWHFFIPPGWRKYNTASLEKVCAWQWVTANRLALDASRAIPPAQWIRLRYEDLFERPVEMFREAFARLDIPFDERMRARCASLAGRPTSIVKGAPSPQKWKEHNPEAIERILPLIAPLMREMGYDPND
ncbi:sulfotransferase family protein [Aromatoleum petrolei]|uniref:Sulfotransferase n=1 Tax=Aromatoleum petrolei TaxID=76116 RepID=A0ABX1MHE7_9RHOO|nr:sulfotransferase [Aromatoleum petrolei]NMF87368.1 sulfotransferase [Aromatoleum petrolei]QTQ35735.1 Putative sulfotransferase [Aromatoleum petrolei]